MQKGRSQQHRQYNWLVLSSGTKKELSSGTKKELSSGTKGLSSGPSLSSTIFSKCLFKPLQNLSIGLSATPLSSASGFRLLLYDVWNTMAPFARTDQRRVITARILSLKGVRREAINRNCYLPTWFLEIWATGARQDYLEYTEKRIADSRRNKDWKRAYIIVE